MSITVQFVSSLANNLTSPSRWEPLSFLPPETKAVVTDFLGNADEVAFRASISGSDIFSDTGVRERLVESVTHLVHVTDEWQLHTQKPLSRYDDLDYAMRELQASLVSASHSASECSRGCDLEVYRTPAMSSALTASRKSDVMPAAAN